MEHPATGALRVRFIDAGQALPLRAAVLRPGQALDVARIPGEDAAGSFHLGVFPSAQQPGSVPAGRPANFFPIAVASFLPAAHPDFPESPQYQLRGMAANPSFRGLGGGRTLMRFALHHLKQNGVALLWCNAREKAIPFYLKCGFRETGPFFHIPDIGLHKLMHVLLQGHNSKTSG